MFDFLVEKCGKPDLTIILYSNSATRKKRISDRNINDRDIDRNVFSDSNYEKIIDFVNRYDMPFVKIDSSNMGLKEVVIELERMIYEKLQIKHK